jgi:hypothetical protein
MGSGGEAANERKAKSKAPPSEAEGRAPEIAEGFYARATRPLIALSYGLGILRLGENGWNLLGLIALIGAIALRCLPEMFLGSHRQGN